MSVRPNISGFKLQRMLSLFGSGDRMALDGLLVIARERYSDDEAHERELCRILERVVMQGRPFPELDVEESLHIDAARILAHYDQQHMDTSSDFYGVTYMVETLHKQKPKPSPEIQLLFRYLCDGRPLFGNAIEHTPQYYAYLSLEEIQKLRTIFKAPRRLRKVHYGGWDPEYEQNLVACGYLVSQPVAYGALAGPTISEEDEPGELRKALGWWLRDFEEAGLDLWMLCT